MKPPKEWLEAGPVDETTIAKIQREAWLDGVLRSKDMCDDTVADAERVVSRALRNALDEVVEKLAGTERALASECSLRLQDLWKAHAPKE